MSKHPELRARALISILEQRDTIERARARTPKDEAGYRLRDQFFDDHADLVCVAERRSCPRLSSTYHRHRAVDRMLEEARVKRVEVDRVAAELEHEHGLLVGEAWARSAEGVEAAARSVLQIPWVEAMISCPAVDHLDSVADGRLAS